MIRSDELPRYEGKRRFYLCLDITWHELWALLERFHARGITGELSEEVIP